MNRTLLLILCDFLLLTLLALTKWETAEPERPEQVTTVAVDGEGGATPASDIVELMKGPTLGHVVVHRGHGGPKCDGTPQPSGVDQRGS